MELQVHAEPTLKAEQLFQLLSLSYFFDLPLSYPPTPQIHSLFEEKKNAFCEVVLLV